MHGTNVKIILTCVAVFLTLLYMLPHPCYNLLHTPQCCYSYYSALPSDIRITLFVVQCVLCITLFVLPSVVIHIMLHCHLIYASQYLCCYLLYTLCCVALCCYTHYAVLPSDIRITILCCQPLYTSQYLCCYLLYILCCVAI